MDYSSKYKEPAGGSRKLHDFSLLAKSCE